MVAALLRDQAQAQQGAQIARILGLDLTQKLAAACQLALHQQRPAMVALRRRITAAGFA